MAAAVSADRIRLRQCRRRPFIIVDDQSPFDFKFYEPASTLHAPVLEGQTPAIRDVPGASAVQILAVILKKADPAGHALRSLDAGSTPRAPPRVPSYPSPERERGDTALQ